MFCNKFCNGGGGAFNLNIKFPRRHCRGSGIREGRTVDSVTGRSSERETKCEQSTRQISGMVSSVQQEYRFIRETEEVKPADPGMACSPFQDADDSEFS